MTKKKGSKMIVNWLDLKIQKLNNSFDFQDQMSNNYYNNKV
jgi:hypothetical protein